MTIDPRMIHAVL